MNVLVVIAFAVACAATDELSSIYTFSYIKNVAIPLGEKIRKIEEEKQTNITVPQQATVPYLVGVLLRYLDLYGTGVSAGTLITPNCVIISAHCWNDGVHEALEATVVLGSNKLFSGGTRLSTSEAITHPNWNPPEIGHDIILIKLATPASLSKNIKVIPLPSSSELNKYEEKFAVVSVFCPTQDGSIIYNKQVEVISNDVCLSNLHHYNLCTREVGGTSYCRLNSGGPLVLTENNEQMLIGLSSYSYYGTSLPREVVGVFSRVASYINFINQNM